MPEGISKQEQEWIVVADENEKRKTDKEEGEALARMIDRPDSEIFPDSPRSKAGILEEDDPQVHRALQALTRLRPPSISLVCLHLVGDAVFLDPDAQEPVNLNTRPHPETRRLLAQVSVSVSKHAVYSYFKDQLPPTGWQKDPVLRHMRAAQFVSGAFSAPGFILTLDPELRYSLSPDQAGRSEMAKPKSAKTDRKQSEEDLCRHSKEQFNLIDEHWIPVVWKPDAQGLFGHTDIDARPPEIGLRDTLLHSHEIAEIADQSPLVTAALHRLLTALVHAIYRGPEKHSDWVEMWEAGIFDATKVHGYFKQWLARFWLFHPGRPFLQWPDDDLGNPSSSHTP